MSAPALYVAGTDTGVGKTVVAKALCRSLVDRGLRVGVFKPAETGCEDLEGPADVIAIKEASGCRAPLDTVCPYRLREPMAPAVAARRSGITIDTRVLDARLGELRDTHDVVVCEGAGGLLVPLADGVLNVDWVADRGLPVLLVGRLGLGTINHTLLSARYLEARGIPLLGTLLSATAAPSSPAEATNPEVLAGFPEVKYLGTLPFDPNPELPPRALAAVTELLP